MSITSKEWRELTESKFWRPEVGKQYTVVMTTWRFERRAFNETAQPPITQEERRPTFVANVVNINGQEQEPPKEFSSSNKALNRMLMSAVMHADTQGRPYIKLAISRTEPKTYSVVDLAIVDQAIGRPVVQTVQPPAY